MENSIPEMIRLFKTLPVADSKQLLLNTDFDMLFKILDSVPVHECKMLQLVVSAIQAKA